MATIFKFNQYDLIKENKSIQNLKVNTVEECNIKRKKFPAENFTTQEIIEIKKIFDKDPNLKYNIYGSQSLSKNILDINKKCIVEKLEDEWFILKVGSFTDIEKHYIIDGFNDVRELLKLLPFAFPILELFISSENDGNIDKSTVFHTLLNDKSSIYEKIRVILLTFNSKLLDDTDVLEILRTKCINTTLLVKSINVIYKNNKDILWNSQLCLNLLKNNS